MTTTNDPLVSTEWLAAHLKDHMVALIALHPTTARAAE